MNICRKCDFKPIEQLPNGEFIIRYGEKSIKVEGIDEELVTFTSSQYPEKPSMERIRQSLKRYILCQCQYLSAEERQKILDTSRFAVY